MNTVTAAAEGAPPALRPLRQDAQVMALVGLVHGTSHFMHMLLSPLFPLFITEFTLSYTQVGLLVTVFFVVSGVGQALSGFLVDRVGARPVLFASLGVFVLAALTAAGAQGYAGLIAASVLAGIGNATFHPVDFTILNQRVSPARLGHAYSVHGLAGNLGWALASAFFVGIASLSSWRHAYLAAAALIVVVLAVCFIRRDLLRTEVLARPAQRTAGPAGPTAASSLAFLRLPVVWWCFAFFLLSTMTLAVIQSFSASILQALHGVSLTAAAQTVTAYMLCGAAGIFVGGWVASRSAAQSDRIVAWSMAAGALLLGLCATGWLGGPGTMAVLAATGFAVGIAGPSRDLMIKRATPKGATGRVYGTVYSGLDLGFALSPLIFGWLMDRGWYAATLAGAALVLLLAVGAALSVGRRTGAPLAPLASPA